MAGAPEPDTLSQRLCASSRRCAASRSVRLQRNLARSPERCAGGSCAGRPGVDLAEAMVRYTYSVGARSSLISMPEVKAAGRLLLEGSRHVAAVLYRVAPAVAGADEAAQLLGAVADDASRLLDAPGQSMSPPRADLVRAGNDLLDRCQRWR